MSRTRYASVLGLGFGDCGKGLFIDALARRWGAHTVVRFSGGAQAAHNVVTRSPARHHTFSQFGAGSFVPGTRTLLLDPMIIHPTALLIEAQALQRIGIQDALPRLMIDGRCIITTPYHQAAGRLRELSRGDAAHGTCGIGVGETVGHALAHPDQALHYQDLTKPAAALAKLHAIRQTLLTGFLPPYPEAPSFASEIRILNDESLATEWLNIAAALARQCAPAHSEEIAARLHQPGCVLFEGSQGILLDEWRGFHPHTTWSSLTPAALETAVQPFQLATLIEHYGAIRSYPTRHGPGPFPTFDPSLDRHLPEPHNPDGGWQGSFRRGHPDAVLLRYALQTAGPLTGLLISHLDVFQKGFSLKWCESYTTMGSTLTALPLSPSPDLSHQAQLTRLLESASPQYSPTPVTSADDFLHHLARLTSLPILLRSYGNSAEDIFR